MMARQSGPIFLEGTLDDITFYKMDGEYYARMKSRLTRKRVLKSPRFALTRMHANQLAEASRIASIIYRQIPKEEKSIKLFRSIVGKAKVLLAEGKEKEKVLESLGLEYRTRNKEPQNDEGSVQCSIGNIVKGERSEVKERSELLVNQLGRLVGQAYSSSVILNHSP